MMQDYLPILALILLLLELSFHLFQLHSVLVDGLRLLINLLLQGARDLHHVLIVSVDLVSGFVRIFLEVFQTESTLVQSDIERGDITIRHKS